MGPDDLVFLVKAASFSIECPDHTIRFNKEETPKSVDVECTIAVRSEYNGTIDLSCSSSSLTGINCATPSSVAIPSGATTVNFTVTLDADTSIVVGQGDVLILASDGSSTKNSAINVLVVSPGGEQLAIYDSAYGSPLCDLAGISCSSGDLLYGRGSVTPEPNYPNTVSKRVFV
jgi:hypothetical protein